MQLENTQQTQERLKEELQMRRTELDKIDTLEDKIKTELAQLDEKSEAMKKEMETFGNVRGFWAGHDVRVQLNAWMIQAHSLFCLFDDMQVGDMRQKAEEARAKLEALRASLLKRKDLLRIIVAEKAVKYQAKKAQLQESNLQVGHAGAGGCSKRLCPMVVPGGMTVTAAVAATLQISLEKMEQKLRQTLQASYTMADFISTRESETNYKGLAQTIGGIADELNSLNKTRF